MFEFLSQRGRLSVLLLLAAVGGAILLFLNEILFPFILAVFLAYVLAPVIKHMHQWQVSGRRLPRGSAVLLLYLIILLVLTGGGMYLVPRVSLEISRMVQEVPGRVGSLAEEWAPVIEERIDSWRTLVPQPPPPDPAPVVVVPPKTPSPAGVAPELPWAQLLEDYVYEIRELDSKRIEITAKRKAPEDVSQEPPRWNLNAELGNLFKGASERFTSDFLHLANLGREFITKVVGSIFMLFLTFMVAGFILVDTHRIAHFWQSFIPTSHMHRIGRLMEQLDAGLNGVVRGQIIICLVNGFLTLIGLLLLGIPFAITLALVATVFSLIPIFGTILSSIPIVVMGLTVSFSVGVLSLAWILLIHFIEANFLNPKIMGTAAHIHPAIIVFALVTGEYLAGIAGALLAVPIYSICQTLFLFFKGLVEELERPPGEA